PVMTRLVPGSRLLVINHRTDDKRVSRDRSDELPRSRLLARNNFRLARHPPRIDTTCGDHFLDYRYRSVLLSIWITSGLPTILSEQRSTCLDGSTVNWPHYSQLLNGRRLVKDYPPVQCPRGCINGSRTRAGT